VYSHVKITYISRLPYKTTVITNIYVRIGLWDG